MPGSEKRQLKKMVNVRVTDELRDAIRDRAETFGLSVSDYMRSIALSHKPLGVRAKTRLPSAAEQKLAAVAIALTDHTAELNKIGSNINQIAHACNSALLKDLPVYVSDARLSALTNALEKERAETARIRDALMAALRINTSGED